MGKSDKEYAQARASGERMSRATRLLHLTARPRVLRGSLLTAPTATAPSSFSHAPGIEGEVFRVFDGGGAGRRRADHGRVVRA